MRKLILIIGAILIETISFGQSAEELNKQSKEFIEKKDFKSAIPLLLQAAQKGNAEAQYNLAFSYQQGLEVNQDDSIANVWLLKAAKQGWKDAQFKIAYSYATGRGWAKDEKQAFYWSLKCADQLDTECMLNVANCYLQGFGTNKNIDSMLMWATRLASLETPENLQISGHITSARVNLATMYRDGFYVSKDLFKSYMWFLIYNESKRDFSILEQQKNIEAIKNLEKVLEKSDIDKGKVEAEKLLQRPLRNISNLYKEDL